MVHDDLTLAEKYDEVEYIVNRVENKLMQSELMKNIENKKYHDLLNNSNDKTKARMLAYRSSKANSWMQMQIGPDIGNIYSLNNEQYKMITRLHFGKDITSRNKKNEDIKCTKCGMINDNEGNHAFNCISGEYNHTWRHDQINKELCKLLENYTMNYKLEPRKLDNNEQRPDIIV